MKKYENAKFTDFEVDGIDTADYPDFCDAFIPNASVIIDGEIRECTDDELDFLNEDRELVYDLVINRLY